MSTKEREKSSGKPRRGSRKPKQRGQKADRQQRPKPDQRDEDQIGAMVASNDAPANDVAAPSELPSSAASTPLISEAAPTDAPLIAEVESTDVRPIGEVESTDGPSIGEIDPTDAPSIGEVAPPDVPSIGAVAPADNRPVSIRTIANAYGTYTEKSFQETSSFVEKLMGVRSFDKVIEVQTEFARQSHATFVAESQKICELYAELAKEIVRSWQGFAAKVTQTGRQIP